MKLRVPADFTMARQRWPLLWACALGLMLEPVAAEVPGRAAQEPAVAVSQALYQYHQGNLAEALTRLPATDLEAGTGALVQGRVLLAYGMTGAAQTLFETVMTPQVAAEVRNQAWFELGRTFYQQGEHDTAGRYLARVDGATLQQAPAVYHHWLYLRGQLALRRGDNGVQALIAALPVTSLWQAYLRYNLGVGQLQAGELAAAGETLSGLLEDLGKQRWEEAQSQEARALEEQVTLSLGQLQFRQQAYSQALATLSGIALDRPASDRALLFYALAASHNNAHGRALAALEHLEQQLPLAPAALQVPIARGYVYEQLEQPDRAIAAYNGAVSYYQARLAELDSQRDGLSESALLGALVFRPGEGDDGPVLPLAEYLGSTVIPVESSGYLPVAPARQEMASLLAGDGFQRALARLHELYRLQDLLQGHRHRLGVFAELVEVRARERARYAEQSREALARAADGHWRERQQNYQQAIHNAIQNQDTEFFMNNAQADTHARITRLFRRLDALPVTAVTTVQRHRAERLRAWFDQQMADRYSRQRWQARKALINLKVALAEFHRRQLRLETELAREPDYPTQLARIEAARNRVDELQAVLADNLVAARSELLAQAEAGLERQQGRLDDYLLAARQALSRVSDQQLQATGRNPGAATTGSDPGEPEVKP